MTINWSNKNESYYGIVPQGYDLILAIQEQVNKTLEIAQLKKGWDCVIFDIWIYTDCRLISSVQDKLKDVGIGSDFIIAMQLNQISNALKNIPSNKYSAALTKAKNDIIDTIKITFQNEEFLMSFDDLWQKNPFVIRFCLEGVLQKFELQFGK